MVLDFIDNFVFISWQSIPFLVQSNSLKQKRKHLILMNIKHLCHAAVQKLEMILFQHSHSTKLFYEPISQSFSWFECTSLSKSCTICFYHDYSNIFTNFIIFFKFKSQPQALNIFSIYIRKSESVLFQRFLVTLRII